MVRVALLASVISLVGSAAGAAAPGLTLSSGDLVYTGANGQTRLLSHDIDSAQIGPDGHTVVMVRQDQPSSPQYPTSVWMADLLTGAMREVIGPHDSTDPKDKFESFGGPSFSPDGGTVYVNVTFGKDGATVHAVSLQAGTERYVVDGVVDDVIEDGPYRGDLLVERDTPPPISHGVGVAVYVVSPGGKVMSMVPGSDTGVQNAPDAVRAWLKKNGWRLVPSDDRPAQPQ
jgi:hypothetical protein